MVHQRGFADIRATHDGHKAATIIRRVLRLVLQKGFDIHLYMTFLIVSDAFAFSQRPSEILFLAFFKGNF